MSLIAAWMHSDGKNITMGADTRVISDYDICSSDDLKIYHVGEALVGISGQLRFLQYVKYKKIIRKISEEENPTDYIFEVATTLREVAKENDFATEDSTIHSRILIGLRGKLYTIGTSFEVVIHPERYAAIGYENHAIGIMSHINETKPNTPPFEVIQKALAATSERIATVGPPYVFISSKNNQVVKHDGTNIISSDKIEHHNIYEFGLVEMINILKGHNDKLSPNVFHPMDISAYKESYMHKPNQDVTPIHMEILESDNAVNLTTHLVLDWQHLENTEIFDALVYIVKSVTDVDVDTAVQVIELYREYVEKLERFKAESTNS